MDQIIKSFTTTDKQILDDRHPPIVKTKGLADHSEAIPAGTIVAENDTGATVEYNPSGDAPTNVPNGVLLREAAADADVADILVHGCVFVDALLVGGSAVDTSACATLEANTQIFVTER